MQAALAAAVAPGHLRAAVEAAARAHEAGEDPAAAARDHLAPLLDTAELEGVLADLTADAYAAGGAAAGRQLAHPGEVKKAAGDLIVVPPESAGIDWDNWRPGDIGAAAAVADGGLAGLLDDAGIGINGITGSALDALGNQIGDGLIHGLSVDGVADSLDEWVTDARAERIAHTETARAVSAATLDTYAANGIGSWRLVLADGACQQCQDVADGGPYPAADTEDAPPIHPYCRCSAAPTGDDAEQFAQELLTGAGIGDEAAAPESGEAALDDAVDEGIHGLAVLGSTLGLAALAGGALASDAEEGNLEEANLAENVTVLGEQVGEPVSPQFGKVTRAEEAFGLLPTDTEGSGEAEEIGGADAVSNALLEDLDSREEDDALTAGLDAGEQWAANGRKGPPPPNPFGANQQDLADLWDQGFATGSSGTGLAGEAAEIASETEDLTGPGALSDTAGSPEVKAQEVGQTEEAGASAGEQTAADDADQQPDTAETDTDDSAGG